LFSQTNARLPPGPQVLATDKKYPAQQYKRGTPSELMRYAKEDALGLEPAVDKNSVVERSRQQKRYNVDEFGTLLRSKFICAWGECYGPKKKITQPKEKA
jgi:hypothetical protein